MIDDRSRRGHQAPLRGLYALYLRPVSNLFAWDGDFAIKKLAEAITESVRPDSVCARFGGDEFVIFNKNVSDKDAESFERKLNRKLENKNEIFNKPYKISASVGSIITVANDDTTLFNLIQQADDAMYEIKKRKKNSRSFV